MKFEFQATSELQQSLSDATPRHLGWTVDRQQREGILECECLPWGKDKEGGIDEKMKR